MPIVGRATLLLGTLSGLHRKIHNLEAQRHFEFGQSRAAVLAKTVSKNVFRLRPGQRHACADGLPEERMADAYHGGLGDVVRLE